MRQSNPFFKITIVAFPLLILAVMTNCSRFSSFSKTEEAKFLSQNPVFRNSVPNGGSFEGNDIHDEVVRTSAPEQPENTQTRTQPAPAPAPAPTARRQTITPTPTRRAVTAPTRPVVTRPAPAPSTIRWCGPNQDRFQVLLPSGQYTQCRACVTPGTRVINGIRVCEVQRCSTNSYIFFGNNLRKPSVSCVRCDELNSDQTACQRRIVPKAPAKKTTGTTSRTSSRSSRSRSRSSSSGGGGSDSGGPACPLMIDSQGVEYADIDALRNSDDSYFNSGELSFTSRQDGTKFNLMGRQTLMELESGQFLHIKPEGYNFKFQISWTRPEQSRFRWLTLPDTNGHINGIDELFGDNTFGPDSRSPFAEDGFRALMKWDRGDAGSENSELADGYIDSNDAVFSKLRLWHDLNGDGNCDSQEEIASELVSLDQVGITYIHIGFTDNMAANQDFFETDIYGNNITYKSLVGFKASRAGATRLGTAFDVWFRYDATEIVETGYAEIKEKP